MSRRLIWGTELHDGMDETIKYMANFNYKASVLEECSCLCWWW